MCSRARQTVSLTRRVTAEVISERAGSLCPVVGGWGNKFVRGSEVCAASTRSSARWSSAVQKSEMRAELKAPTILARSRRRLEKIDKKTEGVTPPVTAPVYEALTRPNRAPTPLSRQNRCEACV